MANIGREGRGVDKYNVCRKRDGSDV